MEQEKHCIICGVHISNGDVFHDMAVKYCDGCRQDAYRRKTADRMRRYRSRNAEERQASENLLFEKDKEIRMQQERNQLLAMQNAMLREQLERMVNDGEKRDNKV